MMELAGLRVLITGASSGIGEALTQACVVYGCEVVGIARRGDRLANLRDRMGTAFTPVKLDLSEPGAASAIRSLGRFDIVVSNAGRGLTVMPLATRREDIQDMMKANVYTAIAVVEGTVQEMVSHGKGLIVVVGSILGRVPYAPWRAAYSASKAALAALVAGWRQELAPHGIGVTLVNPGLTTTEFQAKANPNKAPIPSLGPQADSIPSSVAQTPDEVANKIIEAMISPRDEVYTREEIASWMVDVFASLARGEDPLKSLLVT